MRTQTVMFQWCFDFLGSTEKICDAILSRPVYVLLRVVCSALVWWTKRWSYNFAYLHHNASWWTVKHHDPSWCIVMHRDASWCIMLNHDASRAIKMHHDPIHDAWWSIILENPGGERSAPPQESSTYFYIYIYIYILYIEIYTYLYIYIYVYILS